jgi:hypothetical protein
LKEWLPNADDVIKAVKKKCINNTPNKKLIQRVVELCFK